MSNHAVIAVRGGPTAKSRLSGKFDGSRRSALVTAMLGDMLAALRASPSIEAIWVATPTPALAVIAAENGARIVWDERGSDLNGAFEKACARIRLGAEDETVLLLPGDLPQVSANDIECMIRARTGAVMAIAETIADGGTAAIALPASSSLHFAYGPDSFARHLIAARASGLQPRVVTAPGLVMDVDRPNDIDRLNRLAIAGRTGELLQSWKIDA
jgi:2-phospho-L-lactate guanylyltransferase